MADRKNKVDVTKVKQQVARLKGMGAKKWAIVVVALAFILLAYGYIHTRSQLSELSNPKTAAQGETKKIVSKVSKLAVLPQGETPTLATVNDVTKLKNQSFFQDAQNGDKLLIYTHSGRAVLYRPSADKVVAYSIVNLNNQ
jgi:hypothetical protein